MAKDILRQDVKDVIAAHKGGELGARSVAKQRVPAVGIGVKNATSSNVATGTPLKIDGFSQELEYDAALSKLLNDALYLAATAPDETTPSNKSRRRSNRFPPESSVARKRRFSQRE